MRKGTLVFLGALLLISLAALPFLGRDCSILPEKATGYYEQKAARDAQADDSPEAELMRLLLGGAAAVETVPVSSAPAFSWYGLALALAAGLSCLALFALAPRDQALAPALLWAAALSAPLGLLGARLVYCAASAGFYLLDIQTPEAMLRLWEGGLSLTGALAFAALAGCLAARIRKLPASRVLDAMAPALLIFAAGARLSEMLIGAGYGPEMPFSLPALTRTIHDAPRLNTALLMALFALLPLFRRPRGKQPGRRFAWAAFLYGGALLLLESLRRDGHLLWGFVHAEQAFALVISLAALLCLARPAKRALLSLGLTALLAGAIVALEFALDRSAIADGWLYLLYAGAVGGYLAWGFACEKRGATL